MMLSVLQSRSEYRSERVRKKDERKQGMFVEVLVLAPSFYVSASRVLLIVLVGY